jgi:hypothetical protein
MLPTPHRVAPAAPEAAATSATKRGNDRKMSDRKIFTTSRYQEKALGIRILRIARIKNLMV